MKKLRTDVEYIKSIRALRDLSQQDLAKETGIPLGTIKNIESNVSGLSDANAQKLASFFKVDANKFYLEDKKSTIVITHAMHKGGVGKSTTACNLAHSLAQVGRKVLLIDTDVQLNTSRAFCDVHEYPKKNFFEAFLANEDLSYHILKTEFPNIDIIKGAMDMQYVEGLINTIHDNYFRTEEILRNVKERGIYDYILFDTSGNTGALNTSILYATDEVILPMTPDQFSLEGLGSVLSSIERVQKRAPNLNIAGILMNRVEPRTKTTKTSTMAVKEAYPDLLLKTTIPKDSQISLSQLYSVPLTSFGSKSKALKMYVELVKEVEAIVKKRAR